MSDTAFTIDKDRPIPARRYSFKYPFGEMEVGDSFLAENKKAVSAAHAWASAHPGVKFATRSEGDGTRVWRLA